MLNDHNFKCNFSTLTVFTFLFRNNSPPPEILTMSRAQRDSDVPVFSDRLPCTPLSGAATALPEWSCLSPQDLRSSPAGDPSSPRRGARSPAESTSAGLRGPAAHRGQGRRLSISDAFVSGGRGCFPDCQWENRDDFAQIFGKDSLWKANYNADCHFN